MTTRRICVLSRALLDFIFSTAQRICAINSNTDKSQAVVSPNYLLGDVPDGTLFN